MAKIKSEDFEIYYETRGAGKPLVLIPGFASGAWSWFRQTEALSKTFRVITFDPRGIGKSKSDENAAEAFSMQSFVEDVGKILDRLEIEKAHVLGASFGGFVAQEFSLFSPERVDKLILACTTAGGANHVAPDIEILRSFTPDPALPLGEKIRRFIRPAFTDRFNSENADEVEKVCRMRERNTVSDAAYSGQLRAAFSLDTEEKLNSICCKTLVITGDKDSVVPIENSVNLAKFIPNAKMEIIKDGSHLFFIENAPEFNRAVRDFLENE